MEDRIGRRRRAALRQPSSMPGLLALLVLLAAAGLMACDTGRFASAEVAPDGHAAVKLHATGSLDDAVATAQDEGMDFVCGTFSVPGRRDGTATSACMVRDRGIVAVISFDGGAELTYAVAGPDGQVTVPVDETDVYGVEAGVGQLTLSIEAGGTIIGTVSFGS